MSVEVKGGDDMRRRLQRLAAQFPREAAVALYQEVLIEEKEMKRRCPVAPHGGALRASITTQKPDISGRVITVTVEAGGPSTPYAIAVHEHLSEHSPPSWRHLGADEIDWNVPGTGPKFMSNVLFESAPYMAARIDKRIDLNRLMR
jgi:hypothetical protein